MPVIRIEMLDGRNIGQNRACALAVTEQVAPPIRRFLLAQDAAIR